MLYQEAVLSFPQLTKKGHLERPYSNADAFTALSTLGFRAQIKQSLTDLPRTRNSSPAASPWLLPRFPPSTGVDSGEGS